MAQDSAGDAGALVRELVAGLGARRGGEAQSADGDLLALVARLGVVLAPAESADPDAIPPRRVATAMVQAAFSMPHLLTVFGDYRGGGTEEIGEPDRPAEAATVLPTGEALESCFGLPQWELDDLRDDVDRRASRTLKQARAGQVLWSRFRLPQAGPDPLFRALFPRAKAPGRIGFVRRGAQLYVVCDQSPPADPSSSFRPWVAPPPLRFDARTVDPNLREEIGRGIGAFDEETCDLLSHMITVVPRQGAIGHLAHDGWRSRGYAALSGLCPRYGGLDWITRALRPDEVDVSGWLATREGTLRVGDADAAFAALARQRAELACRATCAEMLARVALEYPSEPILPNHEDLDLYDAPGWLRTVLEPLVRWARSAATRRRLRERSGVAAPAVDAALDDVAGRWQGGLERWCADVPESVGGALVPHLALLHTSLRRLLRVPADPRGNHRDMLLLYAAHDLAEFRLERLWPHGWPDATNATPLPPEDAVGGAFWSAWTRLLHHAGSDAVSVF